MAKLTEEQEKQLIADFHQIVQLTSTMRILLEQCRLENLPMILAKAIDNALREAKEFD